MEKKFYDELKKLEKINQFYKIKEMPTQADWISFSDEDKKNTVELKDESLIHMEKCINENHEIIIEVNKVPPPDDNEKKRPKPKNMNPEDIKPVYSVGVVDLKEFYLVPGKKEIILRTPLMLKETYEKRKENNIEPIVVPFEPQDEDLKVYLFGPPAPNPEQAKKEEKKEEEEKEDKEEENNIEQNDEFDLDYIEKAHTYIYYKLNFSESINPRIPGFESKLEPVDLIQENTGHNIPSAPEEKVESLSNPEEKDDKLNKSLNIENEKSIQKAFENELKDKNIIQLAPDKKESVITNERYNIPKEEEKQEKQEKKEIQEKIEIKEKIEKKLSEEEPQPSKSIPANEICADFRKSIKIFISSICKKYDEITGGENSKNPGAKREKGGLANVKLYTVNGTPYYKAGNQYEGQETGKDIKTGRVCRSELDRTVHA
jgi:hypothetical protein